MSRSLPTGIDLRHSRLCASGRGGRCSCVPTYRVRVDVPSAGGPRRQKTKSFTKLSAAKAWRSDALRDARHGKLTAASPITFRKAAAEFVAGAQSGAVLNRSGERYKPSSVREIERAFRLRLTPALGARQLAEIRRADLQRLVGQWHEDGLDPSTIRNTVNAARSLYRQALSLDTVVIDPTKGLALPAIRGARDRVVPPAAGVVLLAALPTADRALWGVAMYAGLRRGELLALRWRDIDLSGGTIAVRRSWDPGAKVFGSPKSKAGTRVVPLVARLRPLLAAQHLASADTDPDALVFPGRGGNPLSPHTVAARARRAWQAAGLDRVTLHECRHTYASLMIAAEVNMKQLSTWMGHSTITITLDRYGHLLPGAEADGAAKLDRFLDSITA